MDQTESFEQARAGMPDISPWSSVFWKPLRRMLQDGHPIDPVTVLYYDVGEGRRLPFASIAKTKRDRLILWPPTDAREPGEFKDGHAFPIDHVTLELWNNTTHFTSVDVKGERFHDDQVWKLGTLQDGLKLWLIGAFSVPFLEKQVGAMEQDVRIPEKEDPERRPEEFRRYVKEMTSVHVNTPPLRGDYLITVIHLLDDPASFRAHVKPEHFPTAVPWHSWIDGWSEDGRLLIVPHGINVGGVNLLLLTVVPPGHLKGECFLGGLPAQHG